MNGGNSQVERRALRQALCARRGALSAGYRQRAATRIHSLIAATPWLQPGAAIGLYVDVSPEVATASLRRLAQRRGCLLALPRITNYRERRMALCLVPATPLRPNRFGIGEPPAGPGIRAGMLSVLFLPVVGFDAAGTRLGTGAGYYDRLLAWRLRSDDSDRGIRRHAPLLVGLAYDCTRTAHIPAAAHDVPLDAVVTESGIQRFNRQRT